MTFALALALLTQAPGPAVRLVKAEAILPHDFSHVRGVRELPDGRVLVSDWTEELVVVADLRKGSVTPIGRKGTGPLEYRLPGTLLPLPGDSTLLVDEGNSRLAVLGPDLRIVRSFSSHRPGVAYAITPRGVDQEGWFYFEIPNWARPAAAPTDSTIIARWNQRTERVEELGRLRGITYRTSTRIMGIPYVIFAPQDVWQVDRSGRLVVVRSAGYRVEVREAGGRTVRGPATPYRPVAVTQRDRIEYVTEFMAAASVSGRGEGGVSAVPSSRKTPEAIATLAARQEFAPERAAFTDTSPRIAPDGRIWVERSMPAGSPRRFDVFDARGIRISDVTIPSGRRLATFGKAAVYLIASDEDGIERLERYALPALR